MNYFELYGIEESFNINLNELKNKFFELSKKYHPDFFVGESEEKQQEVLEMSTLNTNAFNTLKDKSKRIEYILNINGLSQDIEKTSLPKEFLMEMMDINERLMELEFDPSESELIKLKNEIQLLDSELESEVASVFTKYSPILTEEKMLNLEKVKNYYLKKKYILRINETLNKFASHSGKE